VTRESVWLPGVPPSGGEPFDAEEPARAAGLNRQDVLLDEVLGREVGGAGD
jgi:hypothetical protein